MIFSKELRDRRQKKGMSLREAEKRTNHAISYSMLSRYERGLRLDRMSVRHAQAISKLFLWNFKDMSEKIALEVAEQQGATHAATA